MKKSDVIQRLFNGNAPIVQSPMHHAGRAFAPTNIALCKYWGKRDVELNLPMTSSLSVAIPKKGAHVTLKPQQASADQIVLNDQMISTETPFAKRLTSFLALFRSAADHTLHIDIKMNIPVAAGFASSACGFAAIVLALNELYAWDLPKEKLSILARLGSGSAARSLWQGFVEWEKGAAQDGMDSYAKPLLNVWQDLCFGLVPISDAEKPISSRDAMQRTVATSLLYKQWPDQVARDLARIKNAIHHQDFTQLGESSEANALAMHATMLNSWPPVCYYLPETIAAMHRVWQLRQAGVEVYFTQDAGPNLKLLFQEKDSNQLKQHFSNIDVQALF